MNPYLEVILRSVAVYLFVILAIRLFGKKELAQLSVIDLVFILLISNSVQNAMVGPDTSLVGGMLAAGSLFALNYVLKFFLYRNKSFSQLLQGNPVMLVHQGKVIHEHLEKEKISLEELEAAAREHGVENIKHVDLAVLEADGNISILSHNYEKRSVRRRKAHKVLSKTT
ncbi:MAG: DUF421 domain-containing protein [Bacteroidetes bacterium]|nr:DUF421 domain-containing protein [Bacteroidota bacterium]